MTTIVLNTDNGLQVTRFAGGVRRGVCYQITISGPDGSGASLQLTALQMKQLVDAVEADNVEQQCHAALLAQWRADARRG